MNKLKILHHMIEHLEKNQTSDSTVKKIGTNCKTKNLSVIENRKIRVIL